MLKLTYCNLHHHLVLLTILHSFCHVLGPCVHKTDLVPTVTTSGHKQKEGGRWGRERKESHLPLKSRDPHLAGGERSFLYLFFFCVFFCMSHLHAGAAILSCAYENSIFAVHRPNDIQYVL